MKTEDLQVLEKLHNLSGFHIRPHVEIRLQGPLLPDPR